MRISDVRKTDVRAWISELSAQRSASIVIRAYGVLAAILDDAVSDRQLAANPIRDVKLPRKARSPHVYLTHAEVARLVDAAGEHGTLVQLLAYCGLRWGEATELRPADLDLLRRRITIATNAVRTGDAVVVGTTKRHKSRTVPLTPELIKLMAQRCEGKGRDDLLFPNRAGGYLRPNKWFRAACRRANVPLTSPHQLRHVCAGLAVQSGASVKAVQAMLGHESAAMTLDIYSGLFDGDLDDIASRMSAAAALERTGAGFPGEKLGT